MSILDIVDCTEEVSTEYFVTESFSSVDKFFRHSNADK